MLPDVRDATGRQSSRPNDDEREFLFKLRDERAASAPN